MEIHEIIPPFLYSWGFADWCLILGLVLTAVTAVANQLLELRQDMKYDGELQGRDIYSLW